MDCQTLSPTNRITRQSLPTATSGKRECQHKPLIIFSSVVNTACSAYKHSVLLFHRCLICRKRTGGTVSTLIAKHQGVDWGGKWECVTRILVFTGPGVVWNVVTSFGAFWRWKTHLMDCNLDFFVAFWTSKMDSIPPFWQQLPPRKEPVCHTGHKQHKWSSAISCLHALKHLIPAKAFRHC